ncbi:MAG: DUF512 domain-containing protein [Dethiobacter sp.]|jgi:pyruvate-formate lyase-activating enzyme|nr:DUF512 domain-containing protein [Dethiobacter sp.]
MPETYYPYLLQAVSVHNVLPLTSACNLHCIFCSHRQNPPGITTYRLPPLSVHEVEELASFLTPGQKVIIGESATRIDEGEPLTHPDFLQILSVLRRELPDTLFSVTTNGTLLTSALIDQLVPLAPLEFTVSLNSASAQGRRLLLGDTQPERAISAVKLLSASGIPFHGSLVAMPHLLAEEDIVSTISFLAENGARTARLFLPGYTKFAHEKLRFPLTSWQDLSSLALDLTRELDMPVIAEPAKLTDFKPLVYGVMPATPAQRAGVEAGDEVVSVNGIRPRTRVDAFTLARQKANPHLCLCRNGSIIDVIIRKERGAAPGFVVNYDFDPSRLEEITRALAHSNARAPLFLCSEFGETIMQTAATELGLSDESVFVVENSFFGGSIKAAGLLVVDDLLAAARLALQQLSYDHVFVPHEAFDHTGRDLTGKSAIVLEQELRLPVQAI